MFERLAGKVLTRLLSKYFVQDDGEDIAGSTSSSSSPSRSRPRRSAPSASGGSGTKTQLGVWSGYISLDNLLLKNSVVNAHLKSKGLPFELLRCSVGRVEITVPWGKLGLRSGGGGGGGSSASSTSSSTSGGDSAVVVVVDSVHVLLTSRYEFDDEAMETERIKERREALAKSDGYVHPERQQQKKRERSKQSSADDAAGLAGFFKSRLREGIVNDVLGKVQVHVRDVHIRFEDVETDPLNPHACGVTLESIHIQSDDDGGFGMDVNVSERVSSSLDASMHPSTSRSLVATTSAPSSSPSAMLDDAEVVRKLIQLNHLAVYWNELDPTGSAGHGPAEIYIIQHLLGKPNSDVLFGQAMNDCISRRSTAHTPSTPGRVGVGSIGGYYPSSPMARMSPMPSSAGTSMAGSPSRPIMTAPTLMHTYILQPMDGTLQASLSKTPHDLRRGPALSTTLEIDSLAYELRDFQYSRILGLGEAIRYHKFAAKYRLLRPKVSVHENPRAWWAYAISVVQEELKKSRTRWSFQRFHNVCAIRKQYCDLYERHCWVKSQEKSKKGKKGRSFSLRSSSRRDVVGNSGSGKNSGVGNHDNSALVTTASYLIPLTNEEMEKLQHIHDGVDGDLNIDEILFLRALVHARMTDRPEYAALTEHNAEHSQKGSDFIRGMISDDLSAEEEYERLLAYLDESSEAVEQRQRFIDPAADENRISVSLQVVMKYGSLSLFTRQNTSFGNLALASSDQKCFAEFTFCDLLVGYNLLGNYKSLEVDLLLDSLEGSEIRSNGSRHIFLSQAARSVPSNAEGIPHLAPSYLGDPVRAGFLTPKRSGNNKLSSVPTSSIPLVSCRLAWKPPRAPHFDVSIAMTVEEMEIIVSPHCEWPLKLHSIVSHLSDSPDAKKFWESINLAYINKLSSAKTGVQAKAAMAFHDHKNIDVNIAIDCPVLRIGNDDGEHIVIDLGNAYLSTEKLAGVARGHINGGVMRREHPLGAQNRQGETYRSDVTAISNGSSERNTGAGKTPDLMPSTSNLAAHSPTRSIGNFSLGTSAISHNISRKRSRGESFSIAGKLKPVSELGDASRSTGVALLHACFYDSFLLCLGSITVSTSGQEAGKTRDASATPIMKAGFSFVLEKSVIGGDHTIPKHKVHCIADELALSVSRTSLACVSTVIGDWRSAPVPSYGHSSAMYESNFDVQKYGMTIGDLIGSSKLSPKPVDDEDVQSEGLDDSDEMEFLDALDTEQVGESKDNVSVWFEENWNTDAESLATRSMFGSSSKFRSPRGRLPSISDVSDVSKSTRRSRQSSAARGHTKRSTNAQIYLNAANLARLDEAVIDDDDVSEDDAEGSDDDSFHSAISLGGLRQLVDELNEDISKVETEIEEQKNAVHEAVTTYREKYLDGTLSSKDKRKHRQLKEEIKIELQRCEAELKALRAAYEDARAEYDSATNMYYNQEPNREVSVEANRSERSLSVDGDGNIDAEASAAKERGELLIRARSLLEARAQRASIKAENQDVQHNLTKWLNRDILFGAFSASQLSFELIDDEASRQKVLDLHIVGINASVSKRSFDTRLFVAVECVTSSADLSSPEAFLYLNGGVKPDDPRALAAQYSHLVSSTFVQEDFLRVGIELRKKSGNASSVPKQSLRCKVAIGVTEVCAPDANALHQWLGFAKQAKECVKGGDGDENPGSSSTSDSRSLIEKAHHKVVGGSAKFGNEGSQSFDIVVQADGIHLRLLDAKRRVDAAFCLAGVGARIARQSIARSSCRAQIDVRLNNAQLLDIVSGQELLGREDIYRPLLNARFRTQLVPISNSGGWVVGGDEEPSPATLDEEGNSAWNCHLGIRIHSISALAALPIISRIKDCMTLLLKDAKVEGQCEEPRQDNLVGKESQSNAHETSEIFVSCSSTPLRWRVDVVVGKAAVNLQGGNLANPTPVPCSQRDGFCISLASSASVQFTDCTDKKALTFAIEASDITVKRSIDEWDILEPMKVALAVNVPTEVLPQNVFNLANTDKNSFVELQLPSTSPWKDQRFDADDLATFSSFDAADCPVVRVAFRISEIRSNVSALACADLVHALGGLKKPKAYPGPRKKTPISFEQKKPMKIPQFQLTGSSPSLDLTVHDEVPIAGGASHKNLLSVLSLRGVAIDMVTDVAQGASIELNLNDASIFDLTTYPGVCVLGPISRKGGKTMKGGYKVTVQLSPSSKASPPSLLLELCLGNYQLLVLPSFFKTSLDFVSTVKEKMERTKGTKSGDDNYSVKDPLDEKTLPLGIQQLNFGVKASGFELLLSSRDVPSYINSRAIDPISVVSFRWKAHLSGEIALCNKTSELAVEIEKAQSDSALSLSPFGEIQAMIQSLLSLSSENLVLSDDNGVAEKTDNIGTFLPRLASTISLRFKWNVKSFQALRTSMRPLSSHELDARGFDSSLCCFVVQPPSAGEQQIVSPFDLQLKHILAGTIMKEEDGPNNSAADLHTNNGLVLNISHASKLDVNFVDILLYIKQSDGGINEAIGVSLVPILDQVQSRKEQKNKNQKKRRDMDSVPSATALVDYSSAQSSTNGNSSSALITQAFKSAVGTIAISMEGVRVTVVPGGATRLTENPIIKAAVAKLCVGFGVTPVLQRESSALSFFEPDLSNIEIGCWYQCELSAHYHNKKLVAWEPLLEPWTVEGQLGCDVTRLLKQEALILSSGSFESTSPTRPASALSSFIHTRRFSSLISTLQSVGSYAASPSKSDGVNLVEKGVVQSSSGASYALLLVYGENVVRSALFPKKKSNNVPSEYTRQGAKDWLTLFGSPQQVRRAESRSAVHPCFSLRLCDLGPMNINVSGAFISDAVGLLSSELSTASNQQAAAPHIIRNESGMQIRFREVLDAERVERGETTSAIILNEGEETPLFLKRNISQSCDPHQAFITLELGPSENMDAAVSTSDDWNRLMKRQYKAIGRVPVDNVGVYSFTLHRTSQEKENTMEPKMGGGNDPAIIVRVALQGGIKVVTVESPVALCNTTGRPLYCEVMAPKSGNRLVHAEIPPTDISSSSKLLLPLAFPIPAHLVPLIDEGRLSLTVSCAEDAHGMSEISSPLAIPERFSRRSAKRGIIKLTEMSLLTTDGYRRSHLRINSGSLRIGSLPEELGKAPVGNDDVALDTAGRSTFIPEQRLVLFRPPIVITNHLPTAIRVQVRIKDREQASLQKSLAWINLRGSKQSSNSPTKSTADDTWDDLGIVCCGEAANWLGAQGSDRVEMRVKMLMDNARGGEFSRDFSEWSSPIVIPQESYVSASSDVTSNRKMIVKDAGGTKLLLSVALESKLNHSQNAAPPRDSTKTFAKGIGTAPRSLAIFVPLWIVDSTGANLEYATSSSHVAGQAHPDLVTPRRSKASGNPSPYLTERIGPSMEHGLADLLQDDEFAHLKGRSQFEIFMVGEDKPKKLSVRRQILKHRGSGIDYFTNVSSVWSNQINLRARDNKKQDIFVRPTRRLPWMAPKEKSERPQEPLALSSRLLRAPERLGGRFGTRFLHVVNRYYIVNFLDQDVEIITKRSPSPTSVRAESDPLPFHFYDSSTVRIRPKGFGWLWSSPFPLRRGQSETFVRVRNRLSGRMIIVQIEMREASKSPGVVVEIRSASCPPFRLENHTTTPIQFYQPLFDEGDGNEIVSSAPIENIDIIVILPYHSAPYAWDRPDEVGRSIRVEIADFSVLGIAPIEKICLGRFYLDDLVPGSRQMWLQDKMFLLEVLADGPTRVLRISDASLPTISLNQDAARSTSRDYSIEVNLSFGVGVSVIDWTPKELVYLRMSKISLDRHLSGNVEHVNLQVGSITGDNQLWVTPYPDLLTVGDRFKEKRRGRERPALRISLRRDISRTDSGGVTMIQSFDLATRQLVVKADGHLVELLVRMLKKAHSQLSPNGGSGDTLGVDSSSLDFRDMELWGVLGQDGNLTRPLGPSMSHLSRRKGKDGKDGRERPYFVDVTLTAAAASKAEVALDLFDIDRAPSTSATSSPQSHHMVAKSQQGALMGNAGILSDASPDSTSNRKIYIEKTRISAIETNISWTGKLPLSGVVPSFLTPALTFEGLPLVLRPFTSSHTYGTPKELIRQSMGHYVSVYRLIDVLVGIAFKPTFMVRAYAYTWQQFIATGFDTVSRVSSGAGDVCAYLTPGRSVVDPFAAVWGDDMESQALEKLKRSGIVFGLYSTIVGGFTSTLESAFRGIASLNSEISESLRYDGASRLAEEANAGRTRPPRLFAHEEGKDLLVDYVDGENAGRALLSRVRMGAYLGEGYMFHGEGAAFIEGGDLLQLKDAALQPMIYLMTAQRLLLLKGGSANLNFCTDIWGVSFERTVQIHVREARNDDDDEEDNESSRNCMVLDIMYFEKESEELAEKKRNQASKYISEHVGLGRLHCTSIKLPIDGGKKLIKEITRLTDVQCFGEFLD